MATKPELRRAVANGYIKASDYNYNFEQLNNYIENGVADNAINKYEVDREYGESEWVLAGIDGQLSIFQSLVDGNKGNSLLDGNYWKQVNLGGSHTMFDTVLKDHILTYEETKGLALQGTYVYKEAIAGSRYGYPDFYNKVVEEFNEATTTEEVNGITVKVHSNGHKFYDVADKDSIDSFYNSIGSAWFYGVDIENERIFLPRDKYFAVKGNAPVVGNGMALGLTNGTDNFGLYGYVPNNSSIVGTGGYGSTNLGASYSTMGTVATSSKSLLGVTTDPTKSGIEAHLETNEDKYLYICVGNTTNYEGVTDVVNQGMEILEQVAQKVNVDGTNLNTEGKSLISGFGMPSGRYIDLTLGANGTTYTAPANGWFALISYNNAAGNTSMQNLSTGISSITTYNGAYYAMLAVPAKKGNVIIIKWNNGTTRIPTDGLFRFVYAEGEI